MIVFPVRGMAAFSREFNPPRHLGVDIFAERGTVVVAPDDGEVRFGVDPMGGLVFNLRTVDGRRFYGAHLDRQQGQDRSVRAGDVLGYVGNTGNAKGTSPHLHFEVHGPDGLAVDPYPLLDESAPGEVKRGQLPPAPVAHVPAGAATQQAGFALGWGELLLIAALLSDE